MIFYQVNVCKRRRRAFGLHTDVSATSLGVLADRTLPEVIVAAAVMNCVTLSVSISQTVKVESWLIFPAMFIAMCQPIDPMPTNP